MEIGKGDVVTILDGATTYEVTEVRDGMARVWPTDPTDPRDGRWVSAGLLRKQP